MNVQDRKPLARIFSERSTPPLGLSSRLLNFGQRIHRDERGMEALQIVMILAVAAASLQVIKYWWPWWKDFFNLAIDIFIEN